MAYRDICLNIFRISNEVVLTRKDASTAGWILNGKSEKALCSACEGTQNPISFNSKYAHNLLLLTWCHLVQIPLNVNIIKFTNSLHAHTLLLLDNSKDKPRRERESTCQIRIGLLRFFCCCHTLTSFDIVATCEFCGITLILFCVICRN